MMKRFYSVAFRCLLALVLPLCLVNTAWAGHASLPEGGGPLERPYAHLHLFGRDLPGMQACPADSLVLLSADEAELKPVPLQVDRRDKSGELQYPQEPGWPMPSALLKPDDELIFMAADAGQPPDGIELPDNSLLIRVSEPGSKERAWFVLACDPDEQLPRSDMDYIEYMPQEATLYSSYMRIGSRPENHAIIDDLGLGAPDAPDVMDRIKMRAEAELFGLVRLTRTEEDIRSQRLAWIDGPVRVVRKMAYSLRMFWNIRSPEVVRHAAAYANQAEFPNTMRVPFDIGLVFTDIDIYTSYDLDPAAGRLQLYSNRLEEPLIVDGLMDARENALDRIAPWWICLQSSSGAFVLLTQISDPLLEMPLSVSFHYVDDAGLIVRPEDVPGTHGAYGFDILDINYFPKGVYEFGVIFYFTSDPETGWVNAVIAEEDSPLELTVIQPK